MEPSLKLCTVALFSSILFLHSCGHINGAVIISPGMPLVCDGDQLELTCTVTDADSSLLEWTFAPATIFMDFHRAIQVSTPSNKATTHWIINSTRTTVLTFSKISAENKLPLISRLLIDPLTTDLNGTVVNCTAIPVTKTASTTVHVLNRHNHDHKINKTEQFGTDAVTVTLEWTQDNSYNITIYPYLPINSSGKTTVQIEVPYNNMYNINFTSLDLCGQNDVCELYYHAMVMCEDPATQIVGSTVAIMGYENPAIEGHMVNFSCSFGHYYNTSICTRNGEWEPDPKEMCDMITRLKTPSDSPLFQNTGIVVGSLLGVLFLLITATAIVAFLIKGRTNGLKFCNRKPQLECSVDAGAKLPQVHQHHDNHNRSKVATGGLLYADIGHTSLQQHQRPSIPALDDTPVEYAKISHNSHTANNKSPPLTADQAIVADQFNDDSLSVNLDSLLIQLRSQVTPKWYEFGEAAGIGKEVLDKFVKQCSPEECIVEMSDYWLRSGVKPTWRDVAKILKTIHLPQLAFDIERVYTTGKLPVNINMTDWIPQTQDSLKCECDTESLPPPIPPKMMETTLFHQNPSATVFVESEPNSAPTLPPKPAPRLPPGN